MPSLPQLSPPRAGSDRLTTPQTADLSLQSPAAQTQSPILATRALARHDQSERARRRPRPTPTDRVACARGARAQAAPEVVCDGQSEHPSCRPDPQRAASHRPAPPHRPPDRRSSWIGRTARLRQGPSSRPHPGWPQRAGHQSTSPPLLRPRAAGACWWRHCAGAMLGSPRLRHRSA
eukprot:scaffold52916_cov225-Isochrysis_galbana.AAC.1